MLIMFLTTFLVSPNEGSTRNLRVMSTWKDIKKYNVLSVGKMYYVAVTHDLAYVAVPYI